MVKPNSNKREKKFYDFKATTYQNKTNGQVTIILPKKQLKKIVDIKPPNKKDFIDFSQLKNKLI
jgi:hypothetical protein